jgi:hypothetical protein
VHPLPWMSFCSTFTNETQISTAVTRTLWLINSSPSLWYHSTKSKIKSFSLFHVHLSALVEPILCMTWDSLI